jgi:hypothetical protein
MHSTPVDVPNLTDAVEVSVGDPSTAVPCTVMGPP